MLAKYITAVVITIKRHDAIHQITLRRARAGNSGGFGEWGKGMELAHHQDRKMFVVTTLISWTQVDTKHHSPSCTGTERSRIACWTKLESVVRTSIPERKDRF